MTCRLMSCTMISSFFLTYALLLDPLVTPHMLAFVILTRIDTSLSLDIQKVPTKWEEKELEA